ncbi:MAG: hypothetical protein ACTHJ9_13975 [Rhodanobacter sp.]
MDHLTGRIGLVSRGKDIWARAIKFLTGFPQHHVIIAVNDHMCISAEIGGVMRRPIKHFPHIEWLPPLGTPEQQKTIARAAETLMDFPYTRLGFTLAGLSAAGLRIPIWLIDIANERGVTCVSHADYCHAAAGIELLDNAVICWPGMLTPYLEDTCSTILPEQTTPSS